MSYAYDSFDRPNGPLGAAETGQAWQVLAGTVTIVGNAASTPNGSGSVAVVDLGVGGQNGVIGLDNFNADYTWRALIFRATDAANFWRFGYHPADDGTALERVQGGVVTYRLSLGGVPDKVRIVLANDSIRVFYNTSAITPGDVTATGTPSAALVDSFNATATRHGVGSMLVSGSTGTTSMPGPFYANSPNRAPNAPALNYPTGGVTVNRTTPNRASWTPSDPDAGDSQSAFDARFRVVGTSTWGTFSQGTPNPFIDVAPGTFPGSGTENYEWQVRTYDSIGTVGPWSASSFFTAATPPPGPSITSPTNGGTVGAPAFPVTWSGATQDAYQVRTVADSAGAPSTGTVYFDSGTVEQSAVRAHTVTFPSNGRVEHVQVRTRKDGLWSPWSTVRITVSYTPPAVPRVTVLADNSTASIGVTITTPPVNLVPTDEQSNFEGGTLGSWIVGGSNPPTLTNTPITSAVGTGAAEGGGTRCLQIIWATGSTSATAIASSNSLYPVVAGKTYTLSADIAAAGTAPIYGVAGTGFTTPGSGPVTADGMTKRVKVTFTPTTTGNVQFYANPSAAAAAGSYATVDAIQLEEGTVASEYHPPSTPASTTADIYRREGRNLIATDQDASFKDGGIGTWLTGGSAAPAYANIPEPLGDPRRGGRALLVAWQTGSTTSTAIAASGPVYRVVAGRPYVFSFHAAAVGTAPFVDVYGAAAQVLSTVTVIPDGSPRRYQIAFTPAASGTLQLRTTPTAATAAASGVSLDAFQLEEGTAMSPWRLPGKALRAARQITANRQWLDRTVAHLIDYTYRAVSVASNGTSTSSAWTSGS